MTARKPLVMIDGVPSQIPEGDTLLAVLADAGGDSMIEAIALTLTSVGQTEIEVPGGYADHAIVVVRNGALLDVGADYTAEDDIHIVLDYPITSMGEAVTVYRFSAFSVANTYSQAQINGLLASKQTQITALQQALAAQPRSVAALLGVDQTNSTVNLVDLLTLDIPGPGTYEIFCSLRFRTAATTTGIGFALVATTGEINAQVQIRQAANGTAAFFEGAITSSGDAVVSTGVQAANTDYPAVIRGTFIAVQAGPLVLQFRSEVASAATVQAGGVFVAREVK